MTLDEIIANMEHNARCLTRSFSTAQTGNASECWCAKCHLIAFRAEMEEMVQKWEAASKRLCGFLRPSDADRGFSAALDDCADELRAKIGEGK